ncbi:hypothetical protein P691DRAFT_659435 [Macrolepiota fuliginosa MF-IS2]|uniref:1-alkyl-2-acetylglycerophosphocholine esterase n=1 Tax=Macrolepiota fuliginosa MF-IS2 TaxID=1400762 RepID=A0A9P5XLI3_9AGAR|nr:hypothetical protein P691DRAFT_659435 [Macrolepiota fuliginosa MF-IS2]
MLSLPLIHGRFPVGVTTFVTPVRPSRLVGSAKLKSNSADHALQLEEVAFTAYYPADTSYNPSKGVDWLFRPLGASLLGLSSYSGISTWLLWPVVYFFGSLIKVPAYRNAPLLHPEKTKGGLEKQWPLVIFSHGLGGSRTAYSQFCARLAASGKVVLALEHRDGTGMACTPRSWGVDRGTAHRTIVYLREADVFWENGGPPKDHPMPWRGEQLAFRHHEIHVAYEAFQKFVTGAQIEIDTIDGDPFDKASWSSLATSGDSIIKHHEEIILAGHSFGGATALSLLATKPVENYQRIPISKVVVLDPWLEPLPTPGPVPYVPAKQSHEDPKCAEALMQALLDGTVNGSSNGSIPKLPQDPPQLFVINSETFTIWKDHFARLQEIVATWEPQGRRIATLIGSKHISFSDFSVLPILHKNHDLSIFDTICRLSLAFLHDRLDEALKEEDSTTGMNIEIVGTKPDGKPKRKLVGNIGHVIVS